MNRRQDLPVPTPRDIVSRPCKGWVVIRRPGYNAQLLYLPALSTGSTATPYGVFRPLVLDACRVLTNRAANNQDSEDFLATDIEGRNRVEINDEPLDVDCYYFLGPPDVEANRNYPIVKTLSAFTFPSVLPDRWAKITDALRQRQPPPSRGRLPPAPSQMANSVGQRDENCAITRWRDSTQCAHLIPKAEESWFDAHDMGFHIRGDLSGGIDHPANGILLRADVRLCFDSHGFVFYPDDNPANSQRFVAYFVRGGLSNLPDLLHRRPVTIHPDIPVQFLYARFAYAIINHPRANPPFKSIPEPAEVVKQLKDGTSSLKTGSSEDSQVSGNDDEPDMRSASTTSNRSIQPPLEEDDGERWRERLFGRIPDLSELPDSEVDDPPETFTGCHVETPHMLRLRSEYIKQNPQVWQTSTSSADAKRLGSRGPRSGGRSV